MRLAYSVFLCLLCLAFSSQSQGIRNQEFSYTLGVSNLGVERFAQNQNLDFVNYLDSGYAGADFIILKLGYKFDFSKKMSANIKLIMMDDIIPDNYDISMHYFARPWVGIGIGSMLNKNWISDFEQHQLRTLPDYHLMDQNMKQFTVYDLGFYVSPTLKPFDNGAMTLQVTCDVGVSSFMKERATFQHKKKFGNERLQYHYETKADFQPYVQPKVDFQLKLYTNRIATVGLLFNSNYFYTKRSINYYRTIQTWTADNEVIEELKMPKHRYTRLEINVGLFARW